MTEPTDRFPPLTLSDLIDDLRDIAFMVDRARTDFNETWPGVETDLPLASARLDDLIEAVHRDGVAAT